MFAVLLFMRVLLGDKIAEDALPEVFRRFAQSVGSDALSAALTRMGNAILADGRIDYEETTQLVQLLKGLEGQEEFSKALAAARADGVITMEESAGLERFVHRLSKGKVK